MNIKVLSVQSQTLPFSTVIKGLRYPYLWANAACKLECRLFFMFQSVYGTKQTSDYNLHFFTAFLICLPSQS